MVEADPDAKPTHVNVILNWSRDRRVAHHDMAAAPRQRDDDVSESLLVVGIEAFGGVTRESRRLAQRRVRRIEIEEVAGTGAVDDAIESRAIERDAGPGERRGDAAQILLVADARFRIPASRHVELAVAFSRKSPL